MDTRITSLIHDLMSELKMLGIEISSLVLFGSQSDDSATEWSDVDIALISSSFQNLNSLQRRKWVKPALSYHEAVSDSHWYNSPNPHRI